MKKILLLLMLTSLLSFTLAQEADTPAKLSVNGYVEAYYGFDTSRPADHSRPSFVYSHNRHNELGLNLGLIRTSYDASRVRARLSLMVGDYANANLAAEPGVLKNVFEAYAGAKLSEKQELWVEAGIFPSHIGFESAIGKDCWNLTRSMMADNSPYFESGAKLSWTSNTGKWFLSGLLLNGWQRIRRVEGNQTPAFGTQVTFKPNGAITLNSSTFIGNDKPDSLRQMRYFHNFYGIFQLAPSLAATVGFDIGAEQQARGADAYNLWYTPVVMLRLTPGDKLALNLRGEYYRDDAGVIIASGTPNGFQTFSYTLGLDYLFHPQAVWRIEGRGYSSKDAVFVRKGDPATTNAFFTTSLAVSF
ncbi:MAG: porin [Bacteroidetes bacterium]|nr:MAG: porin [Bacteroidota bacterium]